MTKLPPDLEALMSEPVKLVTACEDCCGTGHTGESQYMGEFQPPEYERCGSCDGSGKWIVDHHSPDQVRAAILGATERAANIAQAKLDGEDSGVQDDWTADGGWDWACMQIRDAIRGAEKEGAKGS